MSWLICGTLPNEEYGLLEGKISWKNKQLYLNSTSINIFRGTSALIAAAAICCSVLGLQQPEALLAGDCGKGNGSRKLYMHLTDTLAEKSPLGITFHYLLPDVDWQLRILMEIESLPHRPVLVADAGYMYAVKMSGCASSFDLFTPDAGELAFLADEDAPHPFYTRGFLLTDDQPTENLIQRAAQGCGTAKAMLVKGCTDYIVINDLVTDKIDSPSVDAMEAIGGTGDTITGLASALLYAELPMHRALVTTALANRIMAKYSCPTPASQVEELLQHLPKALEKALKQTEHLA